MLQVGTVLGAALVGTTGVAFIDNGWRAAGSVLLMIAGVWAGATAMYIALKGEARE